MNEIREKAILWVENTKKTSEMLENLPDDIILPNKWRKKELLIHIWYWDDVWLRISERMISGEHVEELNSTTYDEKNRKALEDNKHLSFDLVFKRYISTRKKLLEIYDNKVKGTIKDEKSFLEFFSLWWHDKDHLSKAGIDVSDLKQE